MLLFLAVAGFMLACGGSGGGGGGGGTNSQGTTAGAYTITVAGTAGSVVQTVKVSLTVQ
jgi:hypothetical protein